MVLINHHTNPKQHNTGLGYQTKSALVYAIFNSTCTLRGADSQVQSEVTGIRRPLQLTQLCAP